MLYARAISRLARQLFSDVIGIGYVEGEISDSRVVSDVSEQVDITPNAVPYMVPECEIIEINEILDLFSYFDPSYPY